ncbi:hypothetical protein DA89_2643 [Vibrio paracholerae]|nr:hypothetical protein DA89_2643 [Vibrio paracholerae]
MVTRSRVSWRGYPPIVQGYAVFLLSQSCNQREGESRR